MSDEDEDEPFDDDAPSKKRVRKLTEAQIQEAMRLRDAGWTFTRLAARYGVTYSVVYKVARKRDELA